MNVKILASRTPDRAEIWFVDLMGALVTAVLFGLGGGALFASDHVPWWAPLVAVLVGTCWTTRIRITREQPTEAALTTFWVIVPVRRLRGRLASLMSEHSDDWTAEPDDERDEITFGSWSLHCRHADQVAAWLRESAVELATPRAQARL